MRVAAGSRHDFARTTRLSTWARRSLVAELERLALVERLVNEVQDFLGPPATLTSAGPEGGALLESLRSAGRGLRTDVVAADFVELLNRVYSPGEEGDGRLTGRGLLRLRTLVGKRDPGLAAMLLEPVYFAVPANRDQVEDAAEEMFRLAGTEPGGAGRFREELAERLDSPWGSVRYIPIALVMPRIARAMESEHELRTRLSAGLSP